MDTAVEELKPKRVGGRDSLVKLRQDDVISPGGSLALHLSQAVLQTRPRKAGSSDNAETESLTYIASMIQDMKWALTELNQNDDQAIPCTAMDLEIWGCFLDRQLSQTSACNYHSVSHIFEISAGASPLQMLAAFFRDCVHFAMDGRDPATTSWPDMTTAGNHRQRASLDLTVQGILQGYLIRGTHTISPDLKDRDLLVARIFGYTPEQTLTSVRGWHKGLDIFLSAVVVTRTLAQCLTMAQVAQLCVCLEATIPNRLRDNSQPLEEVCLRLCQANQEFDLGLSEEEMIETVQQACDLWNRQVGNIMSDCLSIVLDHTWRLLPEVNPALRKRALYKLSEYHIALQSMTNVIVNMKTSTIVMEFRGIPTPPEVKQFEQTVNDNMDLVAIYLKIRLFAVAVVAAMACLSGGDAPKSFFFGDEPMGAHDFDVQDQLGDILIKDEDLTSTSAQYREEIYDALCGERGMSLTTSFDTQKAPLAAYLYRTLGDVVITKIMEDCQVLESNLPMDVARSWVLLRALPRPVVNTLVEEVSRFTVSRSEALQHILASL